MDRRRTAGGILLVAIVLPVLLHAAAVAAPGHASYVVVGGSMEPTIDQGSVVFVTESDGYEMGDVVAFRVEDRVVVHRVVGTDARGYVTRGDAVDRVDDWRVTDAQVVGEVTASLPVYGHVITFARTPPGTVFFVGVPGLLLLAGELRRLRRRWS